MTKRRNAQKQDLSPYEFPLPGSENEIRALGGMNAHMQVLRNNVFFTLTTTEVRTLGEKTIHAVEQVSLEKRGKAAASSTNNWQGWRDIFLSSYVVTYRACVERYSANPAAYQSDVAHFKEIGDEQQSQELREYYRSVYTQSAH